MGFEFPAIGILTTAGVGLLGRSPIQEWRTTQGTTNYTYNYLYVYIHTNYLVFIFFSFIVRNLDIFKTLSHAG